MNKRDMKKVVLGQLANTLRGCVIIDGVFEDEEMTKLYEVQEELAKEFERRAVGAMYAPEWGY